MRETSPARTVADKYMRLAIDSHDLYVQTTQCSQPVDAWKAERILGHIWDPSLITLETDWSDATSIDLGDMGELVARIIIMPATSKM